MVLPVMNRPPGWPQEMIRCAGRRGLTSYGAGSMSRPRQASRRHPAHPSIRGRRARRHGGAAARRRAGAVPAQREARGACPPRRRDHRGAGEGARPLAAPVAAGPVGRNLSAETDYKLSAEIYTYSKTKGLFAGINLAGTKWEIDSKANLAVYGEARSGDVRGLLTTGGTGGPALVQPFLKSLQQHIGPPKP